MKVIVIKKSSFIELEVGKIYDTYSKFSSICIKSIGGHNLAIGKDSELYDGFVWLKDYRSEMIDIILNS